MIARVPSILISNRIIEKEEMWELSPIAIPRLDRHPSSKKKSSVYIAQWLTFKVSITEKRVKHKK
jgi:hypothetical protein